MLPEEDDHSKVISKNKYFTNGLALKNDGKMLIFSETYQQQLWIGNWNASTLKFKDETPFAKAGNGPWGPEGIAFDENENLFVTIFNESKVNIYKKAGEEIGFVETIGTRPTSCAFDPYGKLGLVVTEAERGEIISYPDFGKGLPIFYG